jgi:plasmid stabilization system protein ParE
MALKIELSSRAKRDIEDAFEYIRADSPGNAVRWRRRLEEKLKRLARMPEAFGFAPENHDAQSDVRQLLFGRYRILYTLRRDHVFVLTVRHGARLFLTGEEIDSIE